MRYAQGAVLLLAALALLVSLFVVGRQLLLH